MAQPAPAALHAQETRRAGTASLFKARPSLPSIAALPLAASRAQMESADLPYLGRPTVVDTEESGRRAAREPKGSRVEP
jgi:hypothetical protein